MYPPPAREERESPPPLGEGKGGGFFPPSQPPPRGEGKGGGCSATSGAPAAQNPAQPVQAPNSQTMPRMAEVIAGEEVSQPLETSASVSLSERMTQTGFEPVSQP